MPYTPLQRVLAKQKRVKKIDAKIVKLEEERKAAMIEVANALANMATAADGSADAHDVEQHLQRLESAHTEETNIFMEACRVTRTLVESGELELPAADGDQPEEPEA